MPTAPLSHCDAASAGLARTLVLVCCIGEAGLAGSGSNEAEGVAGEPCSLPCCLLLLLLPGPPSG